MSLDESEIMISREVYEELLPNQRFLDALREAGIDNWQGYDIAMEMLDEDDEPSG